METRSMKKKLIKKEDIKVEEEDVPHTQDQWLKDWADCEESKEDIHFKAINTKTIETRSRKKKFAKEDIKVEKEDVPHTQDPWLRDWSEWEDIKEDIALKAIKLEADCNRSSHAMSYKDEKSSRSSHDEMSSMSNHDEVSSRSSHADDQEDNEVDANAVSAVKSKDDVSKGGAIQRRNKKGSIDKLIKKICQEAPEVSGKVSNICQFRCPECGETVKGWLILKVHLLKKHSIKRLCSTQMPNIISKAFCHVCKICSARVLCESTFLSNHLRIHNIMIREYRKRFIVDPCKDLPDATYSDTIGNLCVYECPTCKKKFSDRKMFSIHLKNFSHGNIKDAFCYLKKTVYHKCKLCHMSVLCDQAMFYHHLRNNHQVTKEQYCQKTGCTVKHIIKTRKFSQAFIKTLKRSKVLKNACEFACPFCQQTFKCLSSFKTHIAKHDKIQRSDSMSKFMTKGLSYKCEKCDHLVLCDLTAYKNHIKSVHQHVLKRQGFSIQKTKTEYETLRDSFMKTIPAASKALNKVTVPVGKISRMGVTSNMGNLCCFACPKCDENKIPSFLKLKQHCRVSHNYAIAFSPSLVSEARYHSCFLCPMVVLCDRTFLFFHARDNHKMNAKEFENIVSERGGEVFPTFMDWMNTQTRESKAKTH